MNEVMKYLPEQEQGVVRWNVKPRVAIATTVDYDRIRRFHLFHELLDLKRPLEVHNFQNTQISLFSSKFRARKI